VRPLRVLWLACALSAQTPEPIQRLHVAADTFANEWNDWATHQNDNVFDVADKARVRKLRKDFAKVDRAWRDAGYD